MKWKKLEIYAELKENWCIEQSAKLESVKELSRSSVVTTSFLLPTDDYLMNE